MNAFNLKLSCRAKQLESYKQQNKLPFFGI